MRHDIKLTRNTCSINIRKVGAVKLLATPSHLCMHPIHHILLSFIFFSTDYIRPYLMLATADCHLTNWAMSLNVVLLKYNFIRLTLATMCVVLFELIYFLFYVYQPSLVDGEMNIIQTQYKLNFHWKDIGATEYWNDAAFNP